MINSVRDIEPIELESEFPKGSYIGDYKRGYYRGYEGGY